MLHSVWSRVLIIWVCDAKLCWALTLEAPQESLDGEVARLRAQVDHDLYIRSRISCDLSTQLEHIKIQVTQVLIDVLVCVFVYCVCMWVHFYVCMCEWFLCFLCECNSVHEPSLCLVYSIYFAIYFCLCCVLCIFVYIRSIVFYTH